MQETLGDVSVEAVVGRVPVAVVKGPQQRALTTMVTPIDAKANRRD